MSSVELSVRAVVLIGLNNSPLRLWLQFEKELADILNLASKHLWCRYEEEVAVAWRSVETQAVEQQRECPERRRALTGKLQRRSPDWV